MCDGAEYELLCVAMVYCFDVIGEFVDVRLGFVCCLLLLCDRVIRVPCLSYCVTSRAVS